MPRWQWADRKRWKLEDRLGDVVLELEYRAATDRAKEEEVQRVLDRRRRNWELQAARARDAYGESYRVSVLDEQLRACDQVQRLRAWASTVEEAIGRAEHDDPDGSRRWVQWIRDRADQLDPMLELPTWPAIPEPEPHDLAPHLGGLSPDGPDLRQPWVR